jgi:hypothetical protein
VCNLAHPSWRQKQAHPHPQQPPSQVPRSEEAAAAPLFYDSHAEAVAAGFSVPASLFAPLSTPLGSSGEDTRLSSQLRERCGRLLPHELGEDCCFVAVLRVTSQRGGSGSGEGGGAVAANPDGATATAHAITTMASVKRGAFSLPSALRASMLVEKAQPDVPRGDGAVEPEAVPLLASAGSGGEAESRRWSAIAQAFFGNHHGGDHPAGLRFLSQETRMSMRSATTAANSTAADDVTDTTAPPPRQYFAVTPAAARLALSHSSRLHVLHAGAAAFVPVRGLSTGGAPGEAATLAAGTRLVQP